MPLMDAMAHRVVTRGRAVIRFSCSACGRRLVVDQQYAGWPTKCPACAATLRVPLRTTSITNGIPSPPTQEPEQQSSPESTDEKAGMRPPWKDPIIVIGAAVPTLVLIGFLIYLAFDHAERAFESRVVALKVEADRLAASGKPLEAYHRYAELLSLIHSKRPGDGRYQLIAESAERSLDKLYQVVSVQLMLEPKVTYAPGWTGTQWFPSVRQEDLLGPILVFFILMGKIGPILVSELARQQPRSKRRRR